MTRKKYQDNKIGDDFMASDESKRQLVDLIEMIQVNNEHQNEIDTIYDTYILCSAIISEMNIHLVHPEGSRPIKECYKPRHPFWNHELQVKWETMWDKEKSFKNCFIQS